LEARLVLDQLDAMAAKIAPRFENAVSGEERAEALLYGMRDDLGLQGNSENYYDAANSYLNIVLDRRVGLPILLSLVMVALGQRLGLRVEGVGFPGHFMARYEDEGGSWFLDPFYGALLSAENVPLYFERLFGYSNLRIEQEHFAPFPVEAWALRMLNNLRAVYLNKGELNLLGSVLALMLVLEPNRQELWQEHGLVQYRRGELTEAARSLRRYFFLQGHLTLSAPNANVPPSPPALDGQELQLWKLLEEIEAARMRWN
jgi:regulator of sirC expression with transglutaminase-like and TPR domain